METSYNVDKLNTFLNENVEDKKLMDRQEEEEQRRDQQWVKKRDPLVVLGGSQVGMSKKDTFNRVSILSYLGISNIVLYLHKMSKILH